MSETELPLLGVHRLVSCDSMVGVPYKKDFLPILLVSKEQQILAKDYKTAADQ